MNAIELRIGNLVFVSDDDHAAPIQAGGINAMEHGQFKPRPIPLTEEWLLKLGFRRSTDNDCVFSNGTLAVFFDKTDSFCELKGAKPKYVHQLQNLYFALTGEELTIKQPTARDEY